MFDSAYAELAIGLALAFFLLSLLVSWVNATFVRLFSVKGKYLWAYLRDTLDGPANGKARLPAKIYDVFLKLPFSSILRRFDPRPKYAKPPPPATMAAVPTHAAPHEIAIVPISELLYQRLQEIDRPSLRRTAITHIPPNRFSVAVLEILTGRFNSNVDMFLEALHGARSPLHLPLKSLWQTADNNLDNLRKGVENWFEGEMERLTGLYRRHTRWTLTVIATIVALLFTTDSLEYSKMLLTDDAYRSEVVAVASSDPAAMEKLQTDCLQNKPEATATPEDPYACVTQTLSTPAFVKLFQNAPVRFDLQRSGSPQWSVDWGSWKARIRSPHHWLGIGLTIIALLFGAPFWWDVLRRVTGVKQVLSKLSR